MPADESPATDVGQLVALADASAPPDDVVRPDVVEGARLPAQPQYLAERVDSAAARALAPLSAAGHHLLPGRSRRGDSPLVVDVLVGPTGVFVLATRAWRDVTVIGERLFDDLDDVTAELEALVELRRTVEADLVEIGLAPGEIRAVVVLATGKGIDARPSGVRIVGAKDVLAHVAGHGARLTVDQVSTVLGRVLALFPAGRARGAVAGVVAPAGTWPMKDPHAGAVQSALREAATRPSLEDWMVFLDPAQARLARRSFNGPARISGATGTGKTCVGLHRAAHLARTRPGTVLYTTHLRTLPWALRQSLRRMAPDVADSVEFAHVRALASLVLRERGIALNVDVAKAAAAMDEAWREVGAPGLLGASGLDRDYWCEEIEYVIKGRGITAFDGYAELARTGRRYRLTPEVRVAVWEMFEAYQAQLDRLAVHDDLDAVALAAAELQREPQPGRFSAVIIDEAQDLTLTMVRLLYSFVGDAPDGLTLIGDIDQALCPGSYTLAEAGISLAGRGAVLDVNHRSTAQILDFTSKLVGATGAADGHAVGIRAAATAARCGSEPVVERCSTEGERGERMVAWIRSLVSESGADVGDIGVLCAGARGVAQAMDRLMRAGIPVLELSEYGNDAKGAVRVGTVERAKGLEFRQVVMGDVVASWLDSEPVDEVERERRERRRRDLYVGMSRARDGLWVGVA